MRFTLFEKQLAGGISGCGLVWHLAPAAVITGLHARVSVHATRPNWDGVTHAAPHAREDEHPRPARATTHTTDTFTTPKSNIPPSNSNSFRGTTHGVAHATLHELGGALRPGCNSDGGASLTAKPTPPPRCSRLHGDEKHQTSGMERATSLEDKLRDVNEGEWEAVRWPNVSSRRRRGFHHCDGSHCEAKPHTRKEREEAYARSRSERDPQQ